MHNDSTQPSSVNLSASLSAFSDFGQLAIIAIVIGLSLFAMLGLAPWGQTFLVGAIAAGVIYGVRLQRETSLNSETAEITIHDAWPLGKERQRTYPFSAVIAILVYDAKIFKPSYGTYTPFYEIYLSLTSGEKICITHFYTSETNPEQVLAAGQVQEIVAVLSKPLRFTRWTKEQPWNVFA